MSTVEPQGNFDHLPGYATRWKGLVFIGISLIVISLDNTILNVAIPSISRDLGASASQLQWIIDAYVLVFASLLLTMGALSDRFGRKRVLQFGLIMFGIGSAAAGLSTSTDMLIGARAFLGIGGAVIMPATLSIISATFPREERAQAIAIWAAIFALGVGIGPVVGGLLLEKFDWGAVFFVNVPVVLIAVAGGALYLADSKDESAPKLDFPGVVLSITGLFALVYGIIEAGELGWTHNEVLLAFGVSAALLTAFGIWEARNPDAMLPMHFFKNMSFTGANVAMVLVTFALFGSIFFLSQYMQSVLGYSALGAGVRLLPLALTLMIVAANSARVAERIGTKFTVAIGIAVAGTSLLIMSRAFEADTGYGVILGAILVFALGMGLTFSPATNSIMQSVPVSKAGIGSAMNDTTRQLGGALGVAVLGTIMNDVYLDRTARIDELLPQLPVELHNAIASSIQGAHIAAANPAVPDAARDTIITLANGAFVEGMNEAMLIGAVLMYVASVLTLLILPSRVRRPQEEIERETMQRQAETVAAPLIAGD